MRARVGFYFMGGLNSDEETYSEVSYHRCRSSRPRGQNNSKLKRVQTSWLLPAGAEMVACGVYRVAQDRYRVQLGHDWGFLGNFDSMATATLVHRDARTKLRRASRRIFELFS